MDSTVRTIPVTAPRLFRPRSTRMLFVLNALVLVGILVFLYNVQLASPATRVGEVASVTVVAQHRAVYIDHQATAAKRQQAMAAVAPVYRRDPSLALLRKRQAAAFLQKAAQILPGNASPSEKLAALRRVLPSGISSGALPMLTSLSPADFEVVRARSLDLLSQSVAWPFDSNQVTTTEIGLLSTLPARTSTTQRTAIGELVGMFLAPTLAVDLAATTRKQRQAAGRVAPVTGVVYPGQYVVRQGDLVTPAAMDQLTALGIQSRSTGWQDVLGSLLLSGVLVGVLFWYLQTFYPAVLSNVRLLLLIDASILVAVVAARLLTPGHVLLPYFLPVAAASTFAAVLMAPEACVALAFTIAVLTGWVVANSFELTVYYFVTGLSGILAIRQIRQLKQFVFAGVYIALCALAAELAFGLLDRNTDIAALQEYVLAAAFNGFVSSTLAVGAFALLSDYFGVTTMLQLLELSQPSQPLLRRLMVKAPGTYNHSLIVASMVERAAEEVGANSLAAKLGALYHDVGKTTNPHCFVENQLGVGNIHDELRPDESARIIRGHVSHGLRLARQFKLPQTVLDAITEHHGTMTMTYFLHRARQASGENPIDVSLYSYPGPKPQSKETALLMLADGCESAVRALNDHSNEKIREAVKRIFEERIQQGQLDECPLTLQDLERARQTFCSVLNGLYHPRIEYPEGIEPTVSVPSRFAVETVAPAQPPAEGGGGPGGTPYHTERVRGDGPTASDDRIELRDRA